MGQYGKQYLDYHLPLLVWDSEHERLYLEILLENKYSGKKSVRIRAPNFVLDFIYSFGLFIFIANSCIIFFRHKMIVLVSQQMQNYLVANCKII